MNKYLKFIIFCWAWVGPGVSWVELSLLIATEPGSGFNNIRFKFYNIQIYIVLLFKKSAR